MVLVAERFDESIVYNAVCNSAYHAERPFLLLDTRDKEEAMALSIPTAIGLPQPGIAALTFEAVIREASLRSYEREDLAHRGGRTVILMATGKADSVWLTQLLGLLVEEGKVGAAGVLNGGFSRFLQVYPWLMTNSTGAKCPNEILSHNLFLGNLEHAMDPSIVQGMGITHIVNASALQQKLYAQRDSVEYFMVNIDDSPDSDLEQHFAAVTAFIDGAIGAANAEVTPGSLRGSTATARRPRVLVHCNAGMSRSSSLVMAYLISARKMTLRAAYELTQRARHIVAPNLGFRRQLLSWELKCLVSNSCTDSELVDLGYDGGHLTRALYKDQIELEEGHTRTSRGRSRSRSIDGSGGAALRVSTIDVPIKIEEEVTVWQKMKRHSHHGSHGHSSCVIA